MANDTIQNLRSVVPLGTLKDGIYPAKSNEDIIYLYYRQDGDLYKYSTKDNIEINLTNSNAYNNAILFYAGKESSVERFDITRFTTSTVEGSSASFDNPTANGDTNYIYILIPIIFNVHSIFVNGRPQTQMFTLTNTWANGDLIYNVYKSNALLSTANKTFSVVTQTVSEESLETLATHINDKNNPHLVTKEQIGLTEVDNTSDSDKPVSIATGRAIQDLSNEIDANYAKQNALDSVAFEFHQHTIAKNPHNVTKAQVGLSQVDNTSDAAKPISDKAKEAFKEVGNALSGKAPLNEFNTVKSNLTNHLNNFNNPHHITAAQLGLDELSKIFFRQVGYEEEVIDLHIKRGTEEELRLIPILNRQLLFATDSRRIYFDHCNVREAYAGGLAIEPVVDPNADLLVDVPVYYLIGNKENVPDNLKDENLSYLLLTSNRKVNIGDEENPNIVEQTTQTIVIGHKSYVRHQNDDGTWGEWTVEDVSKKQDKIDDNLTTINKSIVGAINEIVNLLDTLYVKSLQIREIQCVTMPPNPMKPNVLYIQFGNYYLGLGYMRMKGADELIDPLAHYFFIS